MHAAVKSLIIPALLSGTLFAQTVAQSTIAEKLGYDKDAILLIVHADDIGLAQSVNAATIKAYENGGISSGSIMVPCPWTNDFASYNRDHPDLDVGIHITLNAEWENYRWDGTLPAGEIPSLLDEQGYFYSSVEDVARNADAAEVEKEVRAQIERAITLGIEPTHLDTHMGSIGARPELFQIYLKMGKVYQLPLLIPRFWIQMLPEEVKSAVEEEQILVDGFFMLNQAPEDGSWEKAYGAMLGQMQPGLNLMIVHLAHDNAEMQSIAIDHPEFGSAWRQKDLDFVSSHAFRKMIEKHQIHLIGWKEIKSVM